MLILGIESSCDETAAAVVRDGREILSNVVASQTLIHGPFGGVVPELASRKHMEVILPLIERALGDADVKASGLDAIAVTQGPGLVGALLVGLCAAKAMAYALKKPLLAVNHLEGHIHSAFLGGSPPARSFVSLVVSGGHTALYAVEPDGATRLLGSTLDDAAGEAFDKVAKLLGLGYPGGIVIDRLASKGDPQAIPFPRAYLEKDSLHFSFSGLKTSVVNFVRRHGLPGVGGNGEGESSYRVEDVVASFQEAVVDVLVRKLFMAVERCGVADAAVVGGVAANRPTARSIKLERTSPPPNHASAKMALAPAAMPAQISGRNLVSLRAIGLSTSFPSASRPPRVKLATPWNLTSVSLALGIWMTFLHFGQGPDLPAN